jgi:hypothetical protein
MRAVVERAYKQWNTILRDYLRSETGLRLTVGGSIQAVPVKVVDGIPRPLAEVMRQFEPLDWLLLNRPAVEAAVRGTQFMEKHVETALATWGESTDAAQVDDIRRVREAAAHWLSKLDEQQAVERIIGIEEDVLGAYFFRVPEIRLYWVAIGIAARALDISPDALTIVVLAHELAHAYTHLGRDIDDEGWETMDFAETDVHIVEGLAQFYTMVASRRLGPRMPAAHAAYEALLARQHGPYTAHREWVEDAERGGEIIRVSMIECRSKRIKAAADFAAAVRGHRSGVRGRANR